MTYEFGKNTEPTINHELGSILRDMCEEWGVNVQKTEIFGEPDEAKCPDIVVCVPTDPDFPETLVVIEVKFFSEDHRKELEKNAQEHLERVFMDNSEVRIVVVILVDESLRKEDQSTLYDTIRYNSKIEYKFYYEYGNLDCDNNVWHEGNVRDLIKEIRCSCLRCAAVM